MKWLIQPVKVEAAKMDELKSMLDIAEISYDIVYPFGGDVLNPDKTLYQYDVNENYFVCGSYPLTRNVFKDRKEAVFSLDEYNFKDLMTIFGNDNFVNSDARIIHSNDLKWDDEEYFIRPANDDKSFNGGIYNANTFKYDGDIVVASLKHISKEHRFFVINGEIITGSLYKLNGSLTTSDVIDENVLSFAKEMISKFNFPGFVIDIATIDNDNKIMELNCLNASGFYDINLYKFINSIMNYYEDNVINKTKVTKKNNI